MIELRFTALKESKPQEYVTRFVFGGLCTVAAGLIAKKFGPAAGGLFLAFPAIFPAGISMIESHERERKEKIGADGRCRGRLAAAIEAAGAALGCCGLVLFGFTMSITLTHTSTASALVSASAIWIISVCLLWELRKRRFFARRRPRKR